jgi:hypothetical protein
MAYDEAWQTIRSQPGMFLYACAVRIGRFWSPLPHRLTAAESSLHRLSRYAVALWYIAEFLLAAIGIWRLFRNSCSAQRLADSVPLLGTSSAERNQPPQHCLFQAVAHGSSPLTSPPSPVPLSHWALKCPALPRWGLLLVVCLLAGHVVYWTDMRMRAPIMPVVAILAAAALAGRRDRAAIECQESYGSLDGV